MTKWRRSAVLRRQCKHTPLHRVRLRSGALPSPPEYTDARFSCKSPRVEMSIEDGSKGFAINPVEPGYPANDGNASVAFHRLMVFFILFSDHHYTGNFKSRLSNGGNRQKRMIDGTQCSAARNDHRGFQMAGQIQHEEF